MRKNIHVDMDAFYASIEVRDRPELRGRPVIVGGRPDGRGVVLSASYEARAFGIRSAMGSARAARQCPDAVFVRPDFAKYVAESRRIHALFAEVTDLVEGVSLDEAYLDVTVNRLGEPLAQEVASRLRARIREATGLTASAGVAPIKFAAKVASDYAKPDGLCVIHPGRLQAFLAALPVGAIPGIGPKTAERCREHGLLRVGDFLLRDPDELRRLFGVSADWFRRAAAGIDDRPVSPHGGEAGSIGAEETFERDVRSIAEAAERLPPIAERVATRLRRSGQTARTITLRVRYADFRRITRSRTLGCSVASAEAILAVARSLLPDTAIGEQPARLLGIALSHLAAADDGQTVLEEIVASALAAVTPSASPS
jgi:DNA polymerase-4